MSLGILEVQVYLHAVRQRFKTDSEPSLLRIKVGNCERSGRPFRSFERGDPVS